MMISVPAFGDFFFLSTYALIKQLGPKSGPTECLA